MEFQSWVILIWLQTEEKNEIFRAVIKSVTGGATRGSSQTITIAANDASKDNIKDIIAKYSCYWL